MDRQNIYVYENICPQGDCLPMPGGCIHVYDHNIQKSSLKPLGQSKTNFMWSIVRGDESLYKWSRSHDLDGHHGYK